MVLQKDPAFDIYHVAFVTIFKSEVHHTSYISENNLDKIKKRLVRPGQFAGMS